MVAADKKNNYYTQLSYSSKWPYYNTWSLTANFVLGKNWR